MGDRNINAELYNDVSAVTAMRDATISEQGKVAIG